MSRVLLHFQIPLYLAFVAGGVYLGLYLGSNEITDNKEKNEEWWATLLRALNLICVFHIVPVAIGFCIPHKKAINCIEKLKERHNGEVPKLYIRYVTRGNNVDIIEESVNSTMDIIKNYDNIVIEVVTDHDVLTQETKNKGVIELTVPSNYEPEERTIYKARALQYALENSDAEPDDYILHMDEESHLTDRALMGIYQHMYQKPDNIGQGMITYRRSLFRGFKEWRQTICALADTIRISDDLSRFRFSFILGNPIFGCKGSYLVMKTQIERDVSMDMPPELCITEDASFAFNAFQKNIKFAFIEGELKEISPSNFTDFIKQRARWIKGLWLIVLHHKCSIWRRIIIAIEIIAWAMMFLNIIAFVAFFALNKYPMPVGLAGINGFIFASYIFSYIYGGWVGGYGYIVPILGIILMPLYLLLETIGSLYGFMTVGKRDFYIIKK